MDGLFYEWTARNNISHLDTPFYKKDITIRVVVGVTCVFSLIGALIIILSYCLDRDIRTKSRQILVHLSVADFGVALANLIGVTVYFDQYIYDCKVNPEVLTPASQSLPVNAVLALSATPSNSPVSCGVLYRLCEVQAFVAGYSTLASVMWTQILAVYVYLLVVLPQSGRYFKVTFMYFAYFFCWGMPLVICFWLLFTDRLGYSPHGGEGWCSLKIYDDDHQLNVFVVVIANDLWIYLTFFIVSILYLSIHCCIKVQYSSYPSLLQGGSMNSVNKVDKKFLLIPLCYLLLRMWTQIMLILLYAKLDLPNALIGFLIYAAGIGDSGQGLVNGVLFCISTPKDRRKFLACLINVVCCRSCFRACRRSRRTIYVDEGKLLLERDGGENDT